MNVSTFSEFTSITLFSKYLPAYEIILLTLKSPSKSNDGIGFGG